MRQGKNDLRRCPFCGNKHVRIVIGMNVGEKHHMVTCDRCTATVSFEEATNYLMCESYWNKRVN